LEYAESNFAEWRKFKVDNVYSQCWQHLLLLSNSGRWCNARRVRSIRLAVTLGRR